MASEAAAPRLTLIAARAANGVIGRNGALPWRLSADLKAFKANTLGNPILMGRKTWDSLGKALPGRANLVLTRDASLRPEGAWAFAGLDVLLAAGRAMARARGARDVCVIGGGALYAQTLPLADRLILTEVESRPEGDAWFPAFDEARFQEVSRTPLPQGPKDDHAACIRVLDRR